MRIVPDSIFELDAVPPEVARNLVDRMFHQTFNLILGVAVFGMLGLFGFVVTGSPWYLGGIAAVAASAAWRLGLVRSYRRGPDRVAPTVWARRCLWATVGSGCSWGAWAGIALFEPEQDIVIVTICLLGAAVLFSAVRNATMRIMAVCQTLLTSVPLFGVLMLSGGWSYRFYGVFIIPFVVNVLSYNRFLHRQTLRLLTQDHEKADLLARLEIAKQELEVTNRHLRTLVATDSLTGTANRRAFDLTSAREWLRAAREHTALSLLLLDIDFFKAFNDFYGHQAGDTCLREVADAVASVLQRSADVLARYGGEEFAVVLPGTSLEGAISIANQILEAVRRRALPHDGSEIGHVTVSIGAACVTPSGDMTVEDLTARADAALYAAKRSGRDRVHAAAPVGAGWVLHGHDTA